MAKFRKKPVVIEAIQWPYGAESGEAPWKELPPDWFVEALKTFRIWPFQPKESDWLHLNIGTLEGGMLCEPGDWIIRGVKGELYPCKPDIFAATYDPVES